MRSIVGQLRLIVGQSMLMVCQSRESVRWSFAAVG
jgi:hypothetical protein